MSDLIDPHLRWCRDQAGWTDRTIEARENVLHRADRDLPMGIEEATADELADWLAQFRTSQTKSTYFNHLFGYYDWGVGAGHFRRNPMTGLPRPKVPKTAPRPVTNDELAWLLDNAAEPFRLWVVLAAGAGLRAMEIAALERRDVTEHTLTVVCGKGRKSAVLPTHPLIWLAVKDLPPGRIARKVSGDPVSARYISNSFGKYLRRRLGICGVTLHRFRHWYGTEALRQSRNIRVAQELLRHDSVTSTQIYTQVADEERRLAVYALPVLTPAST